MAAFLMVICMLVYLTPSYSQYCTGDQGMQSGFPADSNFNYRQLRKRFLGCKYIRGHLTIMNIYATDNNTYDFSFLENIEEISGGLTIMDVGVNALPLKNLKVIRGGEDLQERNFGKALRIYPLLGHKNLLDLSGLQVVMKGNIVIDANNSNCFVATKVNYEELLGSPANQRVILDFSSSLTKRYCALSFCHSSCPSWSSRSFSPKRSYCWGPALQHCQRVTKCNQNSRCGAVTNWCYKSGTKCCHRQCIGGCSGPGSDQCAGCKSYRNGRKCVSSCPEIYFGPYCVSECPKPFYEEKGLCVRVCPEGFYKNFASRRCVPFKQEPRKTCRITKFKLMNILTSADLHNFVGCTHIITKILILNSFSFRSITKEDLMRIFQNVTQIDGNLQISGLDKLNDAEEYLDFLKNLEIARGSVIVYNSRNIRYWGFRRLKQVNQLITHRTSMCLNWFPKKAALEKLGIMKPQTSFMYRQDECTTARCHDTCDQRYGCFGPNSDHCIKCNYLRDGDYCVINSPSMRKKVIV